MTKRAVNSASPLSPSVISPRVLSAGRWYALRRDFATRSGSPKKLSLSKMNAVVAVRDTELKRLSDPLYADIGLVDLEAPRGDQRGRGVIVKAAGLPGTEIGLVHTMVAADRSMLDPTARPLFARVVTSQLWA